MDKRRHLNRLTDLFSAIEDWTITAVSQPPVVNNAVVVSTLLLFAYVAWPTMAHANQAIGNLVVQLDNDEFAGLNKRDRWYSSGVRMSYVHNEPALATGWAWRLRSLCPAVAGSSAEMPGVSHFSIGQNIYTQDKRQLAIPAANDRPIAAYLYGTIGNRWRASAGDVAASLEIGLTGPAALGEPVQNSLHSLLGVTQVPAWSYQLRPRLGINLHFECLGRSPLAWTNLLTQYSLSLGSTIVRAGIGAALAFGPGRASSSLPGEAKFTIPGRRAQGGWSALVGVRVDWVGYDALLDGDTYRYQSEVSSRQVTGQLFASVGFNVWKDWHLEYVLVQRSHDFTGPGVAEANYRAQQIGTLLLRIPLH